LLFPWHPRVWRHWLAISLCLIAAYLATTIPLERAGLIGDGSKKGVSWDMLFNLLVIGLPGLIITFLAVAYIAMMCMTVIADVAIGCHTVDSWPDSDFSEWVIMLRFPLMATVLTTLCGYPLKAIGLGLLGAVVSFAAFPLILSCQLESGSAALPFSLPVLKGIISRPQVWLSFYGFAAVLVVIGLLVTLLVGRWAITIVLAGPILGAILVILSCMLGRVLYLTSGIEHLDAEEEDDE
jgi:hypothetical protein